MVSLSYSSYEGIENSTREEDEDRDAYDVKARHACCGNSEVGDGGFHCCALFDE